MKTVQKTGGQTGAGIEALDSQLSHELPAIAEPIVTIELSSLCDDKGAFRTVRVREAVNQEKVEVYAAALVRGEVDDFPPIVVYEVTDRGSERFVAGGLHRCSAARTAGLPTIKAYLRRGTWHDALGDAVLTNAKHGQSPTLGDVCETLLQLDQDPEYRDLSNVKLGELIGVSEATVRNARKRLSASSNTCDHDEALHPRTETTDTRIEREVKVVRGGKAYTMKVPLKAQQSAPVVETVDPETAVRYADVMAAVLATVRDILDKVDAVSPDGMTAQVLASIKVANLSGADVARVRTGGQYVSQICDHVAAQAKLLARRAAS